MRFDSYHPVINLIYFAAAIVCTIWFHHPVFLGISYVCAFVYSVKLNGKRAVIFNLCLIPLIFLYAAWAVHGITSGVFTGRVEQIFAFTAYIFIMIADHFNAVHVMLMKKLSDSPADVMENLSFGLSVDHVLAVTVSGLLGAVWKFVGPEWVFVLGAAVCLVHFGVAVWLGKRAN